MAIEGDIIEVDRAKGVSIFDALVSAVWAFSKSLVEATELCAVEVDFKSKTLGKR